MAENTKHVSYADAGVDTAEGARAVDAIKAALAKSLDQDGEAVIPTDVLEEDVVAALKECTDQESREMEKLDDRELTELMAKERAEQFKDLMSQMIGQAIEENNEKLSQDISRMVNDIQQHADYDAGGGREG